jgi:hypothetical protein
VHLAGNSSGRPQQPVEHRALIPEIGEEDFVAEVFGPCPTASSESVLRVHDDDQIVLEQHAVSKTRMSHRRGDDR